MEFDLKPEKEKLKKSKNKGSNFITWIKGVDLILRFMGHVLILMLVLWILWAFRKAYTDDSFVFEPFTVPHSLVERGFSGEVIIDKIMIEMNNILSKNYFDAQDPEAYRRVIARPTLQFSSGSRAGYFDLQSLFQLGKIVLGKKDKTIKGHITQDDTKLMLALTLPDNTSIPLSINDDKPLDSIFRQAALFLIRRTTPQYLVYYYLEKQDYKMAESLLQEIDFQLNNQKTSNTYDYDRIQWYMSWTNLMLAQQDFNGALEKANELQQAYPHDLAADAQTVNILMAQVINLENAKTDPSVYRPLAQRAVDLADQIEKQDKNSVFLDKQKAMGWMYANGAYMLQKTDPNSPLILPKYEKAISLLPNASFAYNNLSYFYMDKKNYVAAQETLKKALFAEPNDGNSLDTYAEIMSLTGDSSRFYQFIEKALQNPNPTEGITTGLYAIDKRWENYQNRPRFQSLLKKYAR